MVNPDRWLLSCVEERDDDSDELRESIINSLRKGDHIRYGKSRSVSADGCDLHDKVAQNQEALICALANNNDAEVLAIMYRLFNQEVESLVDLVSD